LRNCNKELFGDVKYNKEKIVQGIKEVDKLDEEEILFR